MNQQGPDLPLAWNNNNNNNKLDKIYKPIVFRILNHRQQRIVIHKIWKMNEMSPMMAKLITLRVSRPWHRERKPTWSGWLPESWECRETPRWVEFTECQRWDNLLEREHEDLQRAPFKYSAKYWWVHAYEEMTRGQQQCLFPSGRLEDLTTERAPNREGICVNSEKWVDLD